MASKPIRVVLVAAHPADAIDLAGGTLAHHAAEGDEVTVALVTCGASSHHWKLVDESRDPEKTAESGAREYSARREKLEEIQRACQELGVTDVRDLDLDDDREVPQQDMVDRIGELLRQARPDVVITHHPYDLGGFNLHATVGGAVIYACKKARGLDRTGNQVPHAVASVFFMGPISRVGHAMGRGAAFLAQPDVYVDITDVVEKKVRAQDQIASQYCSGEFARKTVEVFDGASGFAAATAYAEQFQRYTAWVDYTLPISDFELHRATEPLEEMVRRRGRIIAAKMPTAGSDEREDHMIPKEMYGRCDGGK